MKEVLFSSYKLIRRDCGMKKQIVSVLLFLFSLTSCSSNQVQNSAFIKSVVPRSSVYDNCYVTVSSNTLTYYDLDTGVSTPVCSSAGCKHDGCDNNCTAIIENEILSNPFRYAGKLYYFGFGDNQESRMYKCEENGSSRETVLEFKRSGNDEEYISPMIFSTELCGDKIYLLILESVMSKSNEFDGNFGYGSNGMANYKIGCFDLITDSYSVIYETGVVPDSNMQIYGIYNDTIYANFGGNTKQYKFDTVDDRIAAIEDENSEYNKTKFRKTLKISTKDGSVSENDSQMEWYTMSSAGCWYMLGNLLYSSDGTYIAEAYSMYATEDGLIYYDCDCGNVYLYNDGVVKSAPFSQRISFESRDYYVCDYSNETSTYYYCTKESYFSDSPEFRELEMKQ